MPSKISIRERIMRQWRTNLAAITEVDIGTVHRFDTRHVQVEPGDIELVEESAEYLHDSTSGNVGTLDQTMDIRVAVNVPAPVDGSDPTGSVTARYLAAVEEKLLSDRFTIETATTQKLTYDLKLVGAKINDFASGVVHCEVIFRVYFRTSRTDPYLYATLITLQTEEL